MMAVAKRKRPLPPEVPEEGGGAPAAQSPTPKYETPKPVDVTLPVPRVIEPIERVPRNCDLRRYKVRCEYVSPVPICYVLAKSKESAEQEYLRANDLTSIPEGVKPPRLVTTELED